MKRSNLNHPGFNSSRAEHGFALVFTLLLLLMMTVLGVGALSSTHMQERMTGNYYLQSQAFEAASAGVARSMEFVDGNFPSGSTCNTSTTAPWYEDWVEIADIGGASLRQRMYCLPFYVDDPETSSPAGYELFVLNQGRVFSGESVVATREVEVRIGKFGDSMDPCSGAAMCFPLQPDITIPEECDRSDSRFCRCAFGHGNNSTNPFDGFNSNAFSVVGQQFDDFGHGPAMALPPNLMTAFECEITGGSTAEQCDGTDQGTCSRLGNYIGGIEALEEFTSPWEDACQAFQFVNELYAQNLDGTGGITYINGNHSMGGSDTGEGIMVVEGDLEWNGTPQFDGLIIVLGGNFDVAGGGQGGDGAGSVVVVDLEPKPSDVQGSIADAISAGYTDVCSALADFGSGWPYYTGDFGMEFNGGGTAEYAYGCQELWDAWKDLGVANDPDDTANQSLAQQLWQPNCDPTGAEPAGMTQGIVSWRENIGWRSEDFPGTE